MPVVHHDAKRGVGQHFSHRSFQLDCLLLRHRTRCAGEEAGAHARMYVQGNVNRCGRLMQRKLLSIQRDGAVTGATDAGNG